MNLAERYRTTVQATYDADAHEPGLLPQVLAQACVQILPVDGAGISVTQELRIPLGASDATAARAERLQTTLGEGPCLSAAATPLPLSAGLTRIAERWPAFHSELVAQTPYRSVSSLPLLTPEGRRLGAIDLYLTEPEPMEPQLLFHLSASIAATVAAILSGAPVGEDANGITMPTWLDSAVVHERMNVWAAVGLMMADSVLDNADALTLLRGYAYSHDLTLDEVAEQMITEKLDPGLVVEEFSQS